MDFPTFAIGFAVVVNLGLVLIQITLSVIHFVRNKMQRGRAIFSSAPPQKVATHESTKPEPVPNVLNMDIEINGRRPCVIWGCRHARSHGPLCSMHMSMLSQRKQNTLTAAVSNPTDASIQFQLIIVVGELVCMCMPGQSTLN